MESITVFFREFFTEYAKADFALLFLVDACAFVFIFVVALLSCAFSQRVRGCKKKPFLYLADVFSLITLTVFLCEFHPAQAITAAALFQCVGILFYGALCLFKPVQKYVPVAENPVYVHSAPVVRPPISEPEPVPAPAVYTGVRLDHALSIADKLLIKNLGRGDRQELEKIKTALTVLKVKGSLSPQEGEALNDMFNALLKLMARYDL